MRPCIKELLLHITTGLQPRIIVTVAIPVVFRLIKTGKTIQLQTIIPIELVNIAT